MPPGEVGANGGARQLVSMRCAGSWRAASAAILHSAETAHPPLRTEPRQNAAPCAPAPPCNPSPSRMRSYPSHQTFTHFALALCSPRSWSKDGEEWKRMLSRAAPWLAAAAIVAASAYGYQKDKARLSVVVVTGG